MITAAEALSGALTVGTDKTCPECGERLGMEIKTPWGARWVKRACKCERDKWQAETDERQRRADQARVDELFKYSLVSERFRESTFSRATETQDNARALKIARRYAEKFEEMRAMNRGLIFTGPPGTGKTFLAACIANELLAQGVPLIVTSILRLTAAGGPFSQSADAIRELTTRMNHARLLVLDDLGTERDSEYKAEQVFEIIDSRYSARKPMIITTNLSIQQMRDEQSMRKRRVYDRILEVCYPVQVAGRSWRIEEAANGYEATQRILEG